MMHTQLPMEGMKIDNLSTLPLKRHFYCGAAGRSGAAVVARSIQKFKTFQKVVAFDVQVP